MTFHRVQTILKRIPTMQNRTSTMRFFVMVGKRYRDLAGAVCTKAHHIDYILKMFYTYEEWEKEDNILRGKNPIIHTSAFQYVTVWHSKLMPICFYSALRGSAGAVATSPLNISCSPTFMRQPMIRRYWFISPIKTSCRCLSRRGSGSRYAPLVFLLD